MKRLVMAALVLTLVACTTSDKSRVADATTSPLSDLNLIQANIPAILVEAKKQAYAVPADQGCNALSLEIHALDEALGPDLDALVVEANPGLIERGVTTVGDAAVDALKGAAEGVLPFRSWLRK